MEPYYRDEWVTLYHGDCRKITEWLAAGVLVMDPPYGREWQQGAINGHGQRRPGRGSATSAGRSGIKGDADTGLRDEVLGMWGARPGVVFGDLMLAPPLRTKLVLPYQKPPDAGVRGAIGGFRRDVEAIYECGGDQEWNSPGALSPATEPLRPEAKTERQRRER